MAYQVTFNTLPKTLEEVKSLPGADLKTPEIVAGLVIAALCLYPDNKDEAVSILNFLKGPSPLSPMEQQFINDRFMDGKSYIPKSYFKGATPENGYTPEMPYTLVFTDSVTEFAEPGYKKFDITSGGADSPRSIVLRTKPSTGEWFLWEQYLLSAIRVPVSEDPWA